VTFQRAVFRLAVRWERFKRVVLYEVAGFVYLVAVVLYYWGRWLCQKISQA